MSERTDLDPWDTVTYQQQAHAISEGRLSDIDLAWSPPFSLAYAGIQAVSATPAAAQAWMAWILVPIFVLLLWRFLHLVAGPWPAAFLCLAWIGAPPLLGDGGSPGTGVYLFGLCLLLASLIALGQGRRLLCLLFCALAAWNRLELGVLPLVLTIAWSWEGFRRRDRSVQVAAGFAALLSVVLVLFVLFHEEARNRSRLAFRQNMAVSLQERGVAPPDLGPTGQAVAEPDLYLEEMFPTARSWPEALVENPSEVFLHAANGARELPGRLFALLTQVHLDRAPLRVFCGLFLLLLLVMGLGLGVLERRKLRPRDEGLLREDASQALHRMFPLLLGTFLLLLPVLVLRPRVDFVAPVLPLMLVLVAIPIRSACVYLLRNRFTQVGFPLVFIGFWAALVFWTPMPAQAPQPLRFREAVALLVAQDLRPGTRIMAFEGEHLVFLADPDLVGVGLPSLEPPAWRGWSFQRIMDALDPQYLLVDDWFRLLAARHPGLDAVLAGSKWQLIALTPREFLYRSRD